MRWIIKQWRDWRRWNEADKRGWAVWAPLLAMRGDRADSFEAQWRIRNSNRLYRLTQYGNAWAEPKEPT